MLKWKTIIIFLFIIPIALVGCGKETLEDPTDYLNEYINLWEENDFHAMYEFFTEETQEKYEKDVFVERYEKIFSDLQIEDLSIEYKDLTDEDIQDFVDDKELRIPIDFSMESIAGPITFSHELEGSLLVDEETNDDNYWKFVWDSTFIFPELVDESKITVEKVKPRRGDILDRNRMPLAINDRAYEVGIVLEDVQDKESEIANLASILGVTSDSIEEKLNAAWVEPEHFVPIKNISDIDEDEINELRFIPGVSLKETTGRHYPLENAAAHLIGYISKVTAEDLEKEENQHLTEDDMIGKSGLEQKYEKELRGKEGVKIIITNEMGVDSVLAEKSVEHGETISLTIDINAQKEIYQSLENYAGTASAIHPKTGELLALVSYPAFNPNDFTYGISQSTWDQLSNDERLPMFNRYTATFAPGSVLKPIIAAIGLKDGSITHDEALTINGLTWKKDNWSNARVTRVTATDKPVDLADALKRSDNIYFAQKAIDMGPKATVAGLKDFGFAEKIPADISITASQISNSGDLQDEILLANTSYGQGELEVSPVHLAYMYTPFLNDGDMLKPKLLKDDDAKKVWKENLLSADDAKKMQTYLREVVTDGTGSAAKDKKVAIAGKTGTAELKLAYDSEGDQNAWFVGYDADDEEILIAMLLQGTDKSGSRTVTEKVKDIIVSYKK